MLQSNFFSLTKEIQDENLKKYIIYPLEKLFSNVKDPMDISNYPYKQNDNSDAFYSGWCGYFLFSSINGGFLRVLEHLNNFDVIITKLIGFLSQFFGILPQKCIIDNIFCLISIISKNVSYKTPFKNLFITILTEINVSQHYECLSQLYGLIKKDSVLYANIISTQDLNNVFYLRTFRSFIDLERITISKQIEEMNGYINSNALNEYLKDIIHEFIQKNNKELEREHMRFILDPLFMSEFGFYKLNHSSFVPSSTQVYMSCLPYTIKNSIDCFFENQDQMKTFLQTLVKLLPNLFIRSLFCDIIRYGLMSKFAESNQFVCFIESIVEVYRGFMGTDETFDLQLSLCLDYLTFSPTNNDDIVRVERLFSIVKSNIFLHPSSIVSFIEAVSNKNMSFAKSIAYAHHYAGKGITFQNLILPTLEINQPKVDFDHEFQQTMKAMKWKKDPMQLSVEFAQKVSRLFSQYEFVPPFVPSKEMSLLFDKQESKTICFELSFLSVPFFCFYIVTNTRNHDLICQLIKYINEKESEFDFDTPFSQIISISSSFCLCFPKLLQLLPDTTKLQLTIRAISYHCSTKELLNIMKTPFFINDKQSAKELIRNSFQWSKFAQSNFWMMINFVVSLKKYQSLLFSAIYHNINYLSSIGLIELKKIIIRLPFKADILKLIMGLSKSTDAKREAAFQLLCFEFDQNPDSIKRISTQYHKMIIDFALSFPNLDRALIPEAFRKILENKPG